MKIITKILIALVLFVGLEKLIRTQTHGFRVEKTLSQYPFRADWEVDDEMGNLEALNQPFYFLGSGVQCYAFIGQDQKTVLKVFKHYHLWPSTNLLRKFSSSRQILEKREKRMEFIFASALLARNMLSEKTGVLHLNINSTQDKHPTITVYDNIGIAHRLDLNHTPFALQKRAIPIFTYLETHPEESKAILDSFFAFIAKQEELGIISSDAHIGRNFGVCEGEVIAMDIGSFLKRDGMTCDIRELRKWIQKHNPEFEEYLNENSNH